MVKVYSDDTQPLGILIRTDKDYSSATVTWYCTDKTHKTVSIPGAIIEKTNENAVLAYFTPSGSLPVGRLTFVATIDNEYIKSYKTEIEVIESPSVSR